jgi:hypothetical protein
MAIWQMREAFPNVDVSNVKSATAPLYHLVVAAVSELLNLGEAGTQFVGSLFGAALAGVVFWFAGSVTSGWLRALVVSPLLLSPYFWQSTLWMLNDAAAVLFAFLAFVIALRRGRSIGAQVAIGLLLAAAVGTRQTYVWAVVPAVAVVLLATQGDPPRRRAAAVARSAVPPIVVVMVLMMLWQGLVPPLFRENNAATRSWVAPSYCFAVAAIFLVPIVLATAQRTAPPRIAAIAAIAAALPALIFPSVVTATGNDEPRRGGVIWSVVEHGPTLLDRSLILAILAAIGAWSACEVVALVSGATGRLLAFGLVALAITMCAGGQLYQRYLELPIAGLTVIVLCAAISANLLKRRWPVIMLAAVQAVLTAGIIAKPVISALLA